MKIIQTIRLDYLLKLTLALAVLAVPARPLRAGSIERLIYYDAAGTVSNFLAQPTFPNDPSFYEFDDDFNPPVSGFQSKGDSQYYPELFGSYARGYLEAPTNGNYTFFIASYNDSQLWLSTNETVAGRQLIAAETNSTSSTLIFTGPLFTGPFLNTRQSAPIPLVGGKKYYLEVIHQANLANYSFYQVGWQRPDGVQEIIPALHLAHYPQDPYGGYNYTTPALNPYGYNGGDLPSSAAANEGSQLILQADVIAVQPTTFKWLSNNVPVPGANLSYLAFSPVHYSQNNAVYQFVVTNVYGALTSSPSVLSITPDTTPPVVTLVDTRGNPNGVQVTFSKPVNPAMAANLANYALQIQGGSALVVTQATLLAGQQAVALAGAFNFLPGVTYQLTVSGIQDQATFPNTLSPNPTTSTFVYAPAAGTTYNITTGATNGLTVYGNAYFSPGGGSTGGGYVDLTDAVQYESGVLQFTNVSLVEQFDLQFQASISGGGVPSGDGFSINLAADLPAGPFANEENGYLPADSPNANRLIVAFDNDYTVNGVLTPAIVVRWQGAVVTNVPAGVNGIPPINSVDGHWANVELKLNPVGNLSLFFDGVVVFTNLVTGFQPVANGQLEIAAQTGTNVETHWIDNLYLSYTDAGLGPVGFANNPSLTNLTVFENQPATFSVVPTGAAPFTYQWYNNGVLLTNASAPSLTVTGIPATATNSTAGSYYVVLGNEFSQTNSVTATLTVTPDTNAPQLVSARVYSVANDQVVLTFNKPLNPATATSLATYNLGTLALYGASLSANGLTVTLTTGTLELNQVYLFTITGLKDTTAAGNVLTTTASFSTVISSADYPGRVVADGPVRYWRFDEPAGSPATASLLTGADPLSYGVITFTNGKPTLGAQSLVPSQPNDTAILLRAATSDYLLVDGGVDINTNTSPYPQKSVEFWFNANSVPAPGTAGTNAATAIYAEGSSGSRGLGVYLWRDPANPNPAVAQLIFHAWNNVTNDGPGAPWGATSAGTSPESTTTPPIYTQTTIQAGQTYHVVAVLAGDPVGTNGQLILYVNGVPVSTAGGVGQLYPHNGGVYVGRGSLLLQTGDRGPNQTFDGVLDDFSIYDTALSAATVAQHYQLGANPPAEAGPLTLARLDTLGNPNQLVLTFNQPVGKLSATNLANYALQRNFATYTNVITYTNIVSFYTNVITYTNGIPYTNAVYATNAVPTATNTVQLAAAIPITSATLLGGAGSVQLLGNFGFLANSNYTLTVANLANPAVPAAVLTPNPTNVVFAFSAPTGSFFTFSNGLPAGVQVLGAAYVTNTGGYAGDGFADLTDAANNENGALLFTARHDISQADISFKARLANGSAPPGAGFSVNVSPNLPATTFGTPEAGFQPVPATNVLSVAFNNDSFNPPAIAVLWLGNKLTNVLTGVNGIPPLNSADGHWANVDINLQVNGLLNVSFDGVTVITNLATGFQTLLGAQVGLGADTTVSAYETHWFDDFNLNFTGGTIGPVTIPPAGQPQGTVVLENQAVTLSVVPVGTPPYVYQWYYTNTAIAGANNPTLPVTVRTNTAGAYKVIVSNSFSSATSQVAQVSVQLDENPPALTNIAAYAGAVNQVQLAFNKALDPVTAASLSTYSINTLTITGVALGANNTSVTLYTSQQQNLQTNKLFIAGLFDYAAQPHQLTTNVTFQSGISYYQESLVDGPVRYYRFDETNGTAIHSDVTLVDSFGTAQGTTHGAPFVLGQPPLFTNSTGTSILFQKANTNFIRFAAQEWDVSGTNTGNNNGLGPIFTNRTVEFWFKANSLPYASNYTDIYGNPQTTNHAVPLWTEGANARYFNVYLYGTDTSGNTNPAEAGLYVNAGNIANDGPGAYQQWGTLAGGAPLAVYVNTTVTTNVVYHVVAQLDGLAAPITGEPVGELYLYTNGVYIGASALPAGILYAHAGTYIQIGDGTINFRHDGFSFSPADTYDGYYDDLAIYNTLLSPDRIAAHYQAALTPSLAAFTAAESAPPVLAGYSFTNGVFGLTWNGAAQLQRATNVAGPYTTLSGATSPYYEPVTNQQAFFRLTQ
jgi:hypothetical protein